MASQANHCTISQDVSLRGCNCLELYTKGTDSLLKFGGVGRLGNYELDVG